MEPSNACSASIETGICLIKLLLLSIKGSSFQTAFTVLSIVYVNDKFRAYIAKNFKLYVIFTVSLYGFLQNYFTLINVNTKKGLELLSTYGSNPSNDEVTAAIQDMASNKATLPAVGKASGNLTDEQRAILWQMWTGSASVKNNPWASKNDKALKAAEKIAAENNK